tara:strand:- start:233 stop:514 length:282 start_codon:yes stop_codon:yes gene_type:complete
MNLLDQLNKNLSMGGYSSPSSEMAPRSEENDFSNMRFTHQLIKHLDALYGQILGGELSEAVDQSQIVGDINGIPLVQKHAYYNPGHSAVTESA